MNMNTLVVYYSRKGSNENLARRISVSLGCPREAIRPRINAFFLFLFNLNPGIFKLKSKIQDFDRVILVGPIWMGRFIPPLRSFVKRYNREIKDLVFVTCCGSTYEQKDDKFGHGHVFRKVETLVNGKLSLTQAFPVSMVLPEDQRDDQDAFMKTHLNDQNFQGEIFERFEQFIEKVA
jgi:flavodoxin